MPDLPIPAAVLAGFILISPAALAGDPDAGRELYLDSCVSCHNMACHGRYGPALADLFGRTAGSIDDFRATGGTVYSEAMREADVVWDEETLDRFLEDAQALIPGTSKREGPGASPTIPNAEDRRNVIAYLKTGDTSFDIC